MYLPINGRIAIIDNEIKEVIPLFRTFSKNRIPYVYIDGSDMDWLPNEESELNDIRLVFLDLNLTGNRTPNAREVKSVLYPILKNVISPKNFPYSIVLWSKQENDYKTVLEELFQNELNDRSPISIENFIKSDFFDLDAQKEKIPDKDILKEIKKIFENHQAYSTLVYWENKVHKSADNTLQNIFTAYDETWVNKTNFIIEKLSQAYLGFVNHKNSKYIIRTRGALQAFNNIFYDTLESQINISSNLKEQDYLDFDENILPKEQLLDGLNFKLLASDTELELDYTGSVVEDTNPKTDGFFNSVLADSIDRFSFKDEILNSETLSHKDLSKEIDKKYSQMRKENRKSWKKVYVIVTPLCDKVQNKHRKIRVVKGLMIDKKYKKYIDKKSEAIYISPSFRIREEEKSFVLVLNYRYLFTHPLDHNIITRIKHIKPIFRLRSTIISEIQSKLARHVNRQGILYVE